jgi:AcrR family transcriptional regulator/predicted DNA-binding transcriptional regulator AlpA
METKEPAQLMGIEEIAGRSGLTKESIYRFTRMGLLPRPSKIGFQESLYNEEHLERLKKIRELREEARMSFPEIKSLLKVEESQEASRQDYSQTKKEQIMDKALAIFSRNGFSNTKVSEITDELGVAKGTFYLYFKSKRELFVECMSRLTTIVLPEEVWEEIRQEGDFVKRQRIKLRAFLKAFPNFSGVLSLLRLSLQSDDATIAAKARETYRTLEEPVTKDVRKAMAEGIAREVNAEVVGSLMLGMAESLGYLLLTDPTCTVDEGTEIVVDFVANGLLQGAPVKIKAGLFWDVKDLKGFTLTLEGLRFNDKDYLTASLGEGQIEVSMENVQSILILEEGGQCSATIIHREGEGIKVSVDGGLLVSGQSKLGPYSVPVRKLLELNPKS